MAEGTPAHSHEGGDLTRWLPQFFSDETRTTFPWGYFPFLLRRGTRRQEVGVERRNPWDSNKNGARNPYYYLSVHHLRNRYAEHIYIKYPYATVKMHFTYMYVKTTDMNKDNLE